jgi:hypothetical protein
MDDGIDQDGGSEARYEDEDGESHDAALSAPVTSVQSDLLLKLPSPIIRASCGQEKTSRTSIAMRW